MALLVSESRRMGILNTNCDAAVTSKSRVPYPQIAAAVEAKARPPQAPRRLIKECRRHSLFVPFKVRKGKLSRKVCSVYHWGTNWVTQMHAHVLAHWRWSISVSYSKWFLNEGIELYIVGTQAKVFSDYMRLQGAGCNLCSRCTFIVLFCTV